MDKQYKVIDDRGRLTIPRSVRFLTGITANSIVSLTFSKDEIIIKKEKICDNCQNEKEEKETIQPITERVRQHQKIIREPSETISGPYTVKERERSCFPR